MLKNTQVVRPAIEEVFTPRNRLVNQGMYINRPDLEEELRASIRGSMHTMLFGESGNGKSWLYKHVFSEDCISYVVANCGNASRLNSLTDEIRLVCAPENHATKVSLEESKEATVKAVVADGKLSSTNKYDYLPKEPLLESLKFLKSKFDSSVLVIENLEAIAGNQKLIDELCNIVLLLDDERYAKQDVKLLIVGTPNGVLEFFGSAKNHSSISNRIEEISKVSGLSESQTRRLVTQGLVDQLKIVIPPSDLNTLCRHIYLTTLGIAQRVHEYCICWANVIKQNKWTYDSTLRDGAGEAWLRKGLRAAYVVIESHMNSIDTSVGRRNQAIFSIGKINKGQFYSSDIEDVIAKEFPDTVPETNMGIGAILSELADSDKPLVKKAQKSSYYTIVDPLYIMCIRLVLIKDPQKNKVIKRTFRNS